MVNLLYIVLAIYLVILIILATEFTAYLWHSWGAHTDIVPGVHDTHREHHVADLDHKAHEDFFWIILLLIIFGFLLFWLYHRGYSEYIYRNFLRGKIENYNDKMIKFGLILFYLLIVSVFTWNWYIHQAYHTKNHWLNKYDWFKNDKKIHFQHHVDPTVNYGIASHFSDVIFGTYENPLESEVYSNLNMNV